MSTPFLLRRVSLCLLCLGIHLLSAQPLTPLVDFQAEDPQLWRSGGISAQLQRTGQGIELPLRFASSNRQITLTRSGSWKLADVSSFRFRVGISDPSALLEATLAFKSGNGWYTHGFTLHGKGPAHLQFAKANFAPEGAVSGWNRVEAIRISFWPRGSGSTTLYPVSLEGFQDQLWILDTESAAKTGDETYTARVSKRHLDRILAGLGLPHAIHSLDALPSRGTPRLILIPYLPHLSDPEFQQLSRFITQGSALIVFESTHTGLARKLGVQIGNALSSSTMGQFNHLLLDTSLMPGAPSRIYQHAWSMRGIQPLGADSRVIAGWADALDRPLKQPAAIQGPNGIWLNVAWRSGDTDAKQQLLGEWIGNLSPALLTESLRYHRETRSPRLFEHRHGPLDTDSAPARALKAMAVRTHDAASKTDNAPLNAFRLFRQSDQLMQRAHASSQSPWNARMRGIWDQNGTGFYAGGWERTCRELRAAGFNAVFSNMASAGRAHYPSKLIPPSKSLEQHGDQLRAFAAAARRNGLEAHAWKICWKLNTRLPAFEAQLRREGRLMQDPHGKDLPWLSISDSRNVQFEIDSLLEMARHAELDGIHLDYMRYPGRDGDYGPAARSAFEAQLGRRIPNWPAEVLGPLRDRFQRFRQQELHNAMRNISTAVKKEFPDLKLSVAVWGAWPDCADSQGQNWPIWAREGWVDWIIPMNYTDNPDQLAGWLDLQAAQPGVRERLIPGLGYISTNAELSPTQLLDQLSLVRERNLHGAILYRLDSSLPSRLFPYLALWE
ncbi:MAG: family 10 glycosylhydrolase [Kiritimatiellia bacterium]